MFKYASGIRHSVYLNLKATSLFPNLLFSWVPCSGKGIAILNQKSTRHLNLCPLSSLSSNHPVLANSTSQLPPRHLPACRHAVQAASKSLLTLQPRPNHFLYLWSGSINSSPLEIHSNSYILLQVHPGPAPACLTISCHFFQAFYAPARLNSFKFPVPCCTSSLFGPLHTLFSIPRTLVPLGPSSPSG